MRSVLVLLLNVLLAGQAAAEGPRALITGPDKCAVGDLVILDASQSLGQAYHWVLVNSQKTFLPIEEGRRLVFASGHEGEFIFVLIVGGHDDTQQLAADVAEHRVTIGSPPPAPSSFDVFPRELPGWTEELVTDNRRGEARQLAAVFRQYAAKAAEFQTLAELARATSDDYKLRLGLDTYLAWRTVLERVEQELQRLRDEGLLASPPAFAAAWQAVAAGLERVE
jgi:hypothetical protein